MIKSNLTSNVRTIHVSSYSTLCKWLPLVVYLSSNAFDNNEWICIFKTKSNGVSSIFTTFSWSIARAQCQELEWAQLARLIFNSLNIVTRFVHISGILFRSKFETFLTIPKRFLTSKIWFVKSKCYFKTAENANKQCI